MPESPNPPTISVDPSTISATASEKDVITFELVIDVITGCAGSGVKGHGD
jgi:hypothetical protein